MKREIIYNVLNKENLNEMMIHYFKFRRTYGRRKLFDCINGSCSDLNLCFKYPFVVQNTTEVEIEPNLMTKEGLFPITELKVLSMAELCLRI
jgi:hypothetical protein